MTVRRLPGLTSRELLQGEQLTVTWVEVEPGAAQRPHAHEHPGDETLVYVSATAPPESMDRFYAP